MAKRRRPAVRAGNLPTGKKRFLFDNRKGLKRVRFIMLEGLVFVKQERKLW